MAKVTIQRRYKFCDHRSKDLYKDYSRSRRKTK